MIEEIFSYVKKKYRVESDYPFSTTPDYPVLRHEDNRKWFAIIMDAPGEKLGLEDTDRVEVINVKIAIPCLQICSYSSLVFSRLSHQPG